MQIAPIDIIELIKVVGGLCVPIATAYIIIMNNRQKKLDIKTDALNTKIDGMLADRDAANVRKGERRGEDKADILAEGQRQGLEIARASSVARGLDNSKTGPVPVEDEAAAKIQQDIAKSSAESAAAASEIQKKIADATEKGAEAQQQIADAAKERKP